MKPIKLEGIKPVAQDAGHTCGYCATSAVYKYYGLSPRRMHLRQCLGTDSQPIPYCIPWREKLDAFMDRLGWTGQGTLPMDLFAVLYWDGFDSMPRTGTYEGYRDCLRRHLARGHPAIALVDGMTHWVVVAGMNDTGVLILDSAMCLDPQGRRRTFRLEHRTFAGTVCGVVLVKRHPQADIRDMTLLDFTREYARGVAFATGCLGKSAPRWIRQTFADE